MITAKGHTGTVSFDGRMVTISHEGMAARLAHGQGEKRIPLRSITAVQWKEPAALTNGFVSFSLAGAVEANRQKGGRTVAAVQDENSVVFTKGQREQMHALKVAIEDALAGPDPGYAPPPRPAPAGPPAGWYPDQQNSTQVRWWDGQRWTEHTQAR